ncbi:MAG: LysR family transcriptional regulator [Holophaga sp.]|nr:LysR family transcriptional regulator [Holophaga sp.]
MELRHIHYFLAVAEEQGICSAAKRLHISQPPLTRQIHQLEEDLGVQLLRRAGKGVEITPAGKVFQEGATEILALVRRTIQNTQQSARGEIGQISIGFVDTMTFSRMPQTLIQTFRTQCPNVTVDLVSGSTLPLHESIEKQQISVAFVYERYNDTGELSYLPLMREPVVIAMPNTHPLARKPQITLQDLKDEPFVFIPRRISPRFFDKMTSTFRDAGLTLNLIQECPTDATSMCLVDSGVGLTFAYISTKHHKPQGVVLKPVVDMNVMRTIHLAWRTDNIEPSVKTFVAVAKHYLRGGGESLKPERRSFPPAN